MTLDEYLHTSFENPDPEYVDGQVVERNGGTLRHGSAMTRCACALYTRDLYVVINLRLRVQKDRVRVADVAVFEHEPPDEVPATPPLISIEVLSPDDRVGYIVPKLEEYRQWGVEHIWLADPEDRKLFTYGETGLHEVTELQLKTHGIRLTIEDVFGAE